MNHGTTFVGLDVHRQTITGAAVTSDGEMVEYGTFANQPREIAKRVKRWGADGTIQVCYEAGPCGYVLARQMRELEVLCTVVAPTLLPRQTGNRVKTDRRDALQLAQLLANGMVTAVAVPSLEQEGLRALSRRREQCTRDLQRARQRLLTFLLVQGCQEPSGNRWTQRWWRWAEAVTVGDAMAQIVLDDYRTTVRAAEHRLQQMTEAVIEASSSTSSAAVIAQLQRLHGIGVLTAVGIVAEVGDLTRFGSAPELMAYAGIVPREHSSGERQNRGAITRTGNSHLRFLIVEAAWHSTRKLKTQTPPPSDPVGQIAIHARQRLHRRYWRLAGRGKPCQVAIIAVARELLGFIWAVGQEVSTAS